LCNALLQIRGNAIAAANCTPSPTAKSVKELANLLGDEVGKWNFLKSGE